jgi:tetratricopeptide (TPR) repeat protein
MKRIIFLTYILSFSFLFVFQTEAVAQKKEKKKKGAELAEQRSYDESDKFTKAVLQKELGSYDKALSLLDEALAINPDDPAALYEKARILMARGRKDEAMPLARKAMELDPENKWYKVLFADVAKANEQYDEYISVYENLVKKHPTDLNFLQELAYGYNYIGKYDKSIKIYDKLEEITGINEPLTKQKVVLYDKIGEKEKAAEEYKRLIELNPNEPRYYALYAEYCSKNNWNDKAIWAYEQIVRLNPEDPYVHISLADFYRKNGDEEKAFEELKEGLSNPGLELDTKINLLITYYSGNLTDEQKQQALELSQILKKTHPDDPMADVFFASMLYENGSYGEARDIFKKILADQKQNYAVWEQLLFCDLYLEDYQGLLDDSEYAIDYFPNYPLPYFFAGISSFQLKDFVKAKAYLESGKDFVVNNKALSEQFYSTLGDVYNELHEYDKSYESYEKALELNPENSVVLNNYAYYLSLQSKNLDKAAEMAAKAVKLDPYNQNNLDTYAWVLYKQKKYEKALEWEIKAYNNGGDSSGVVLEHYGDILYRLGRTEEALDFWKRALEKDDHSGLLEKKVNDKKLYEE